MLDFSPRSRRGVSPLALALAALAVAPAAASAVTVTLDRTCYTHVPTAGTQPIVATITGGTPSANFLLAATVPGKGVGSAGSVSGTFDAAGNATAQLTDVFPPGGSIDPLKGRKVDLSVADFGAGGADVPVGSTLITNLALTVSNKPRNPRKARVVRVSGTPFGNLPLYGFVTKPKSGKVLRRFSLGKSNACGYASAKRIVAPRGFKSGKYRLVVNPGKKVAPSLGLSYGFQITTSVG
ncbi:MAG: hypothetical protein ACJ762_11490 [Solirubrobacteraceae bacterium]